MSVLSHLAEELYSSVSDRMEEPLRTQLRESLECGEEGVAVAFTLKWAIDSGTPISEQLWSALTEFYAPLTTWTSGIARERLEKVAHAA